MSVFLMPVEICADLERAMCKFWWNTNPGKAKSIHWMSWARLSSRKSNGGMGFRNVRDFNIALLGKRAWRLQVYPDKLVSRVIKSRYYPSATFLTAKIGSNPSYVWRSVLEAQELLKKGLSCRVGDGRSISILGVPWLPDPTDPYVQSTNEGLINQTVASLMLNGSKYWDTDLLTDMFNSRDMNLIVSIPLIDNVADNWYWKHEKLGAYSVKSAYLMLQNERRDDQDSNSGFWRKLWNLKIPRKVQIFLWRAVNNCLPSKDQLRIKQVMVNRFCPLCNDNAESVLHILVTCPFAKQCWQVAALPSLVGEFNSFGDWLQLVFNQQSKASILTSVMLSWILWKNRNDLVWNQKCLSAQEVVHSALSCLNQWQFVQDRTFDTSTGFIFPEDGGITWQAPKYGSVKISTDAAIFNGLNRFSHAQVIRDHNGSLIEASSSCCQGSVSPEIAEAIRIREALSWVKQHKQAHVIVKTDCQALVQWIRRSFTTLSYIGRLVDQCRQLLMDLQSQNVMLRFVKRSANSVAHYLASYSSSVADRKWKKDNVHSEFLSILCNDLKQ